MSVGTPKHGKDLSEFDRMDTDTLEKILREDLEKTESERLDVDTVIYITEILEERRKNGPSYTPVDVNKAWAEFTEKYLPYHSKGHSLYDNEDGIALSNAAPVSNRPRRRIVRWGSAIAAVLCVFLLVGNAAASALGYDVWGAVAKWTSETFQIIRPPVGGESTSPDVADEGFSSLDEVLADYNLTPDGLAPSWLPDGYELDSVEVDETPMCIEFLAYYKNDGDWLWINIKYFKDDTASIYERDALSAEIYQANGTTYYIFSNKGRETAVWVNDFCECSIVCVLTKSDLYKIIDSLHRE